jgi:hypothetical protein
MVKNNKSIQEGQEIRKIDAGTNPLDFGHHNLIIFGKRLESPNFQNLS